MKNSLSGKKETEKNRERERIYLVGFEETRVEDKRRQDILWWSGV